MCLIASGMLLLGSWELLGSAQLKPYSTSLLGTASASLPFDFHGNQDGSRKLRLEKNYMDQL